MVTRNHNIYKPHILILIMEQKLNNVSYLQLTPNTSDQEEEKEKEEVKEDGEKDAPNNDFGDMGLPDMKLPSFKIPEMDTGGL